MFGNLIENAVRYGAEAAIDWSGGWASAGDPVVVTIDDSGPGLDPDQRSRVFDPSVRGDPSRNRDTDDTGMGLAIVRSIAEAHRGTVILENHIGENHASGGRVPVPLLEGFSTSRRTAAGCSGGSTVSTASITAVSVVTATATPTPSPTPTPTATSGSCIADPTETAGPAGTGSTPRADRPATRSPSTASSAATSSRVSSARPWSLRACRASSRRPSST